MKYIKTFESIDKYTVGDYIFLNLEQITRNNINNGYRDDAPISPLGKIMEHDKGEEYPYVVMVLPLNSGYNRIRNDEVIRSLTPKEIDEFDIIGAQNKYNL